VIRYALLGLVQGLTEFLPVSSSGHLVLAEKLLGLHSSGVLLEAMLHWGTLLAILIVFRSDILALLRSLRGRGQIYQRKEVGFLIAGTVPVVVIGLVFQSAIESAFSSLLAVGIGLIITGAILMLGHRLAAREPRETLRFSDAVIVGLAQAASVFPGVSRSGSTIAAGRIAGLSARQAARFSFLLAAPALFGAGLLKLLEAMNASGSQDWIGILVGTLVAFISGWLAIRVVLRLVQRGRLWIFSLYCALVGIATLVSSIVR
jgi:undecaprenyl-diphosphatase